MTVSEIIIYSLGHQLFGEHPNNHIAEHVHQGTMPLHTTNRKKKIAMLDFTMVTLYSVLSLIAGIVTMAQDT